MSSQFSTPADETQRPVSRRQSQETTRARLLAVGRKHFLRDGLGGAVAESIAAEAGYTRGALYANFTGKEELFLAVLREDADTKRLNFRSILNARGNPEFERPESRFNLLRTAIGDLVTEPAWVLLQAEFQANALRSESIRTAFMDAQTRRRHDGGALLGEFAQELGLVLAASPDEVIAVVMSLVQGLAVQQAISGGLDPEEARRLTLLCFDRLVTEGTPPAR